MDVEMREEEELEVREEKEEKVDVREDKEVDVRVDEEEVKVNGDTEDTGRKERENNKSLLTNQ